MVYSNVTRGPNNLGPYKEITAPSKATKSNLFEAKFGDGLYRYNPSSSSLKSGYNKRYIKIERTSSANCKYLYKGYDVEVILVILYNTDYL